MASLIRGDSSGGRKAREVTRGVAAGRCRAWYHRTLAEVWASPPEMPVSPASRYLAPGHRGTSAFWMFPEPGSPRRGRQVPAEERLPWTMGEVRGLRLSGHLLPQLLPGRTCRRRPRGAMLGTEGRLRLRRGRWPPWRRRPRGDRAETGHTASRPGARGPQGRLPLCPQLQASRVLAVRRRVSGIPGPQFSSAARSCPTLCDPMNRSTPGSLSIANS